MKYMLLALSTLLLYSPNLLAVDDEEEKPATTTKVPPRPLTKQEKKMQNLRKNLAKHGLIIMPNNWDNPKPSSKNPPKSKL